MQLRRIGNRLRRFDRDCAALRAVPAPGKPLRHSLCCAAAARYSRAFGPNFVFATGFAGFAVAAPGSRLDTASAAQQLLATVGPSARTLF